MEQARDDSPANSGDRPSPRQEQGPLRSTTSTIDIYIKLAQYPILADQIRERMREEVFKPRHRYRREV
jgi:hypothetical protein